MHVHCCLSLCLLWEPSTAAVSTLWDYYSRNLVRQPPHNTNSVIQVPIRATTHRVHLILLFSFAALLEKQEIATPRPKIIFSFFFLPNELV